MIDYGRTANGDVLEIVGFGAPGYAAVGDRVRVVHVGLDNIVVEDKADRWAKFIGNKGASRLRPAEPDAANSSDRPREDLVRVTRIPERVSLLRADAEFVQEVDPILIGLGVAHATLGQSSPVVTDMYSELNRAHQVDAVERVG